MNIQTDPFHPIIYVRGYAMSRQEIDETTVDPFCGFNLGSTVYRATPEKDKPPKKFVFESPVIRLGSDFGYADVFEDGMDIMDPGWSRPIPRKSIIVYRYYEQASSLLGVGETPSMEAFAKGLSDLIMKIRDLVCQDPANRVTTESFGCYLVAHSMGGLVCRAFLQNPALGNDEARQCVEKVFTYATPHNGIEMAGVNVPTWLTANEINNFNRDKMSSYLHLEELYKKTDRVDWVLEKNFPSRRFFCLIGTNRSDYEVGAGLSRMFSGHGSDGLVRIENASVWGIDEKGGISQPSATAFIYRSHSGFFGIVNSEESYQNLVRFLFGTVRVDILVDVEGISLPRDVQKEADEGKEIKAIYQFEVIASPRGKRWQLTRRTAEEDSVACATYAELPHAAGPNVKSIYLSTLFLDGRWRVNQANPSLSYSMTLGVRVPDYEVNHSFLPDTHYEGSYLFRDSMIVEIVPSPDMSNVWNIIYYWQTDEDKPDRIGRESIALDAENLFLQIPFNSDSTPGVSGKLRFVISKWNERLRDR
jgi:hypothetical protein